MPRESRRFYRPLLTILFAVSCTAAILSLGQPLAIAQRAQSPATTTSAAEQAPKIPNDQLDSLVAPIALYSDELLAQTLAASTYPLEVIQLQQWLERNKNLKDKALADAVTKQPWDPSVQAMAAFPDVVQRLAGNIQWATDLGNAFLAQQSDVMDAVQRMRAKAQGKGTLKTSAQQKVETQTVEGGKQVIVVEQANPQVVYVPSYDPVVVYGEPAYPYYPYEYPGYYPGMGLAWGAGLALGAAWGGGWGWGCGWGHGDVNVNYGNKYVNHYNQINNINRGQASGNWQHNVEHRGNAPYGDRATANRFAGTARQQPAGGIGNRPVGGVGAATRPAGGAGVATRPASGAGVAARPASGAGVATRPSGGAAAGARPSGARPSTMPASRPSGGGGDRIGGYSPSRGGGGGAFGGGSANSARASSSRGGSSMGGGGFSRGGGGGGGRGGGGRGGGGGGRRR